MPSASLLGKLLVAVLLPTVVSFAGFALLGHRAAQRALEAELGRRLSATAAAVAAQVAEDSVAILSPGDEDSRTYRNLHRRLVDLQRATAAARVYLFAQDHTVRVDTAGEPIGATSYPLELSRAELRRVFAGESTSSTLFRGKDGRYYKTGFAPVSPALAGAGPGDPPPGPPRYAVAVDGSAELYRDLLDLRRTFLWVGGAGVLAMVLLSVGLGRRLTRPLSALTRSARRIGQGDFAAAVPVPAGGDELVVLAQGLEAMRAALLSRDERLQMMLSGIAHEVRNPLGGMELFAGLLRDELAAPTPDVAVAAGYVGRVEREIGHLKTVVTEFLDYARRPRPERASVAVLPLLREVVDCARAVAPAGVEFAVEAPDGLCCQADPVQLRRALLNLAHNAAQAGPGHVRLEAWATPGAAPGGVSLRVSDDGSGIPPEVQPKIWTPFFTTRQRGTGLGLSFVRDIVADHGGAIALDTGPTGTRFTIDIPAVGPAAEAPAAIQEA